MLHCGRKTLTKLGDEIYSVSTEYSGTMNSFTGLVKGNLAYTLQTMVRLLILSPSYLAPSKRSSEKPSTTPPNSIPTMRILQRTSCRDEGISCW